MEPNLLMSRTFLILGGMLVVTTLSARFNKAYETTLEAVFTIGGTFLFLFMVMIYADSYPLNLVMVAIFSGFIGWSLGPTIAYIGERFKFRKYLKSKAVLSKTVKKNPNATLKKIKTTVNEFQPNFGIPKNLSYESLKVSRKKNSKYCDLGVWSTHFPKQDIGVIKSFATTIGDSLYNHRQNTDEFGAFIFRRMLQGVKNCLLYTSDAADE